MATNQQKFDLTHDRVKWNMEHIDTLPGTVMAYDAGLDIVGRPMTIWRAIKDGYINASLAAGRAQEHTAALGGLVGALKAVAGGEPFDEAKLLAGVQEAAHKGALTGTAEAIASIETTVNIKEEG